MLVRRFGEMSRIISRVIFGLLVALSMSSSLCSHHFKRMICKGCSKECRKDFIPRFLVHFRRSCHTSLRSFSKLIQTNDPVARTSWWCPWSNKKPKYLLLQFIRHYKRSLSGKIGRASSRISFWKPFTFPNFKTSPMTRAKMLKISRRLNRIWRTTIFWILTRPKKSIIL